MGVAATTTNPPRTRRYGLPTAKIARPLPPETGKYITHRGQAIREHCRLCCGDKSAEVPLCVSRSCALWKWRRGSSGPGKVEAIRTFCLDCHDGNAAEVRRCSIPRCPLFAWRLGSQRDPNCYFDA